MQGSDPTVGFTYDYEYSHSGKTVQLGVHCGGVAHEPRVCWKVEERSGERGYVSLDVPKPVVRLEEGENARLDGRLVSEIPVTSEVGRELETACEKLGTVVTDSNRIGTDPAAFPDEIAGFERAGWEPARNVMWYWRDERSDPRAYQIERGELVFRAQEWAGGASSKEALIEQHGFDPDPDNKL